MSSSYYTLNPLTCELIWYIIVAWYNDVGRLLNGATNAIDYYLFCDSTYELKTTSSSMAKDTNGNPTSETIAQAYSSLALDFRSFAPFWIETLRIYVFDVRSHDPNTYCTLPNSLGLTQFSTNALAILVCERSFTEEGVDVRLGDTMPTSTGDDIQLFGCVAMTFYHEYVPRYSYSPTVTPSPLTLNN